MSAVKESHGGRRSLGTLLIATGVLLPAAAAYSQEEGALEEVVVTAEKRTENVQTAPLAVTVLNSAELAKRSVRDFRDLQNVSPSLSITEAGILTFMNIRGIGLTLQTPTVVSGVATYRDGLFSPSPIFITEPMFDVASVEVLRGPQGTFVGQNSTGGALFQVSQNPTLDSQVSGNVGLKLGNYNEFGVEGAVNLPVGDTFAARIAFNTDSRDSYFDNIGNRATHPGAVDHKNIRVGLLWAPTDSLQLLWKTEVNKANDGGYYAQPQPGSPNAPFASSDPFTLTMDRTDIHDDEASVRSGLEARWTLDNGVIIRSLSGYQLGTQNFLTDTDGTSRDLSWNFQRILDRVYSQEFDVISPDTGVFRWTAGGSYVKQTAHLDLHIFNNGFPFGPGGIFPTQDIWILTTNPKVAAGAFAQGTVKLGSGFEIQAGARFSHDKQRQEGALTLSPVPPLPGVIPAGSPRYSDDHTTGKVALNWSLNPSHFFYAFAANGFKAGGVNLPAGTYEAETVKDYEVGWKATLADGHVRTQLGVFDMDYRNLQLNVVDTNSGTNSTGNADKSTIKGAELQLQSRFGGFGADLNFSYLDSTTGGVALIDVRSLPGGSTNGLGPQCGPGQSPPGCFDYNPFRRNLAGRPTPYAPKITANLGLEYAFRVGMGSLTPRVDVTHLSEQFSSLFAGTFDRIPGRTIANVGVSYYRQPWRGTLAVTNVTDKTFISGIDDGSGNMWIGAPRAVRLTVNHSF